MAGKGRRRALVGLALVVGLGGPIGGAVLHVTHEPFRREVSWRLTRPWYGWEVRDAQGWDRVRLLEILAAREHHVYEGLLLRYADAPDARVREAAQRGLALHHPGTWPAEARRRFEGYTGRAPGERVGWNSPFGDSVFGSTKVRPVASDQAWEAFRAQYPAFFAMDEVDYETARSAHFEGRPSDVIRILDSLRSTDDEGWGHVADGSLRHYVVEVAPEPVLADAMLDETLSESGRYYARYAIALRQLWRLEIGAALATLSSIDAPSLEAPRYPDIVTYAELQAAEPEKRMTLLRQLVDREDAWRRARGTRTEPAAALALAGEILRIDREIGYDVGFFEPWILVDADRHHSIEQLLTPLLSGDPVDRASADERARARYLLAAAAYDDMRLQQIASRYAGAEASEQSLRKHLSALAADHPRHELASHATHALRHLAWYVPPLLPAPDPS